MYRCGFASDSNNDKQGEELSYCLHSVKMSLAGILDVFEPTDKARLFLQGKGNYRDRLATIQPYKGNRDPSKRPRWFDEIREYMVDYHGAEVIEGQETDDALAQEQWKYPNRTTCIVTIDKDLLNGVPGWSYNYVKGVMKNTSLVEANAFLFRQMLEGDSADNIPGIKGIGPKTVDKLFKGKEHNINDLRALVQSQYQKFYGADWRAAYEEVGNLLWIRRVKDVSCPLLWTNEEKEEIASTESLGSD